MRAVGRAISQCARSGFSLVELLVVIAVISLLIAILSGSLGASKARARSTRCTANLREVGQLVSSYATSNDDSPAPADRNRDYRWSSGPQIGWDITTGRALGVPGGSNSVWFCPEMDASYIGNVRALGVDDRSNGGELWRVSRSRWEHTSRLVLAFDLQVNQRTEPLQYAGIQGPDDADLSDEWNGWPTASVVTAPLYLPYWGPHGDKYGMLFADGHASARIATTENDALLWKGRRWWPVDFGRRVSPGQ